MVTRRAYLAMLGGATAGGAGVYAAQPSGNSEPCSIDMSFQEEERPFHWEALPGDMEEDVRNTESSVYDGLDRLVGSHVTKETLVIDVHDCPNMEDTYRVGMAVETDPESKFSSLNQYLDGEEMDPIEDELARTYSPMLEGFMEEMGDYRPGGQETAATVSEVAAVINGDENGQIATVLDAEGMDSAYRAANRSEPGIRREQLRRVAVDNLRARTT